MHPPASRWRHPRSAHPGGEVWPCRYAVGRWPPHCAAPAAACGGRRDVAGAVTASLSGRGEMPGEGSWPRHRPAFLAGLPGTLPATPFQTPPQPFPHLLACPFAVQLPRAAFPRSRAPFPLRVTSLRTSLRSPEHLPELCFSPAFLAASRQGPLRFRRLSHGTPFTRGTGCPRPPARSSS